MVGTTAEFVIVSVSELLTSPEFADIGKEGEEIEFQPLEAPAEAPVEAPAAPTPVEAPEAVPA